MTTTTTDAATRATALADGLKLSVLYPHSTMRFYRHFSGTDEGENCVLASITFQPQSVLALLLFSGEKGKDAGVPECYWDTLAEFVDEYADQLGKYQGAVVLSYGSNIFDIQLTLYHYRYPQSHLKALCQLIPNVPVHYASGLPGEANSVTDFHEMDDEPFKRYLFGYQKDEYYYNPGMRETLAWLVEKGIRAKQSATQPQQDS